MAEKNIVQTESDTGQLTNIATTDIAGIASFNTDDFTVDADGKVSSKQKVGAIQACGRAIQEELDDLIWEISEYSPKKKNQIRPGDLILSLDEGYRPSLDVQPLSQPGEVFVVYHVVDGVIRTKKDVKFQFNYGGPQGVEGKAASVKVAETITGEPGTDADVKNISDSNIDVELQFTIPRGDKGDKGDQGIQGEPGQDGEDGKDGENLLIGMEVRDGNLYCCGSNAADEIMQGFSLKNGKLHLEVTA